MIKLSNKKGIGTRPKAIKCTMMIKKVKTAEETI